jgi:hypothetical protein
MVLSFGLMSAATLHADETSKVNSGEHTEIQPLSPEQAIALMGGQTLITMHMENVTPPEFLTELWRQAHLQPFDAKRFTYLGTTSSMSIDVTNEPFWSVVRKAAEEAGVSIADEGSFSGRDSLSPVNGIVGLYGVMDSEGPFLFIVDDIMWSQMRLVHFGPDPSQPRQPIVTDGLRVQLIIFSDPKLPLVSGSITITVNQAIDDKGNSLLMKQPLILPLNTDIRFTPSISLPLVPRQTNGGHITSLNGVMKALIVTKTESWKIADIAIAGDSVRGKLPRVTSAGNIVPEGAAQYRLSKVTPIDRGYELDISYLRSRTPLDDLALSKAMFVDLRALDAQGNDLNIEKDRRTDTFGFSDLRNKELQGFTMHFKIRRSKNSTATGPIKLIWKYPVEFCTVEVPFEFKNLPLP